MGVFSQLIVQSNRGLIRRCSSATVLKKTCSAPNRTRTVRPGTNVVMICLTADHRTRLRSGQFGLTIPRPLSITPCEVGLMCINLTTPAIVNVESRSARAEPLCESCQNPSYCQLTMPVVNSRYSFCEGSEGFLHWSFRSCVRQP